MSGTLILRAHELPLDHLANELARKIYTPTEIAERFSTDLDVIWELLQRPEYYKLVKQRRAEWLASSNTAQRAKILSQTTWIESLPHIYSIVTDPKAPLSSRVDAGKLIEKAAAEPPSQQGSGPGGRGFQVNIIFPDRTVSVSAAASLPEGNTPPITLDQEDQEFEPDYAD